MEGTLGRYLGAKRGATNCALANRQIITHLVRGAFAEAAEQAKLARRVVRLVPLICFKG
jgi:tRNA-splicing ligase RtcB